MSRIGLYARVSTGDQSTSMQLDELHRRCDPGDQVTEYVDEGISGSVRSRPSLDRLMGDVRKGKIDAVLVYRFDRFARSTQHLLAALEEFQGKNVRFVSIKEAVDTGTPTGRFLFTLLAAVSELERETIRERVASGIARAQREGTASGKAFGRPRSQPDLTLAVRLRHEGRTWGETATACRCSVRTLQRLLSPSKAPPIDARKARIAR